jgi:hypothetical protein
LEKVLQLSNKLRKNDLGTSKYRPTRRLAPASSEANLAGWLFLSIGAVGFEEGKSDRIGVRNVKF